MLELMGNQRRKVNNLVFSSRYGFTLKKKSISIHKERWTLLVSAHIVSRFVFIMIGVSKWVLPVWWPGHCWQWSYWLWLGFDLDWSYWWLPQLLCSWESQAWTELRLFLQHFPGCCRTSSEHNVQFFTFNVHKNGFQCMLTCLLHNQWLICYL